MQKRLAKAAAVPHNICSDGAPLLCVRPRESHLTPAQATAAPDGWMLREEAPATCGARGFAHH